ncbi:MAG: polysaccharide deacetylase family protein [Clostridia bacterium]|nr:polysaccharide deacetylase family protein [Clostridia bacterium]
MKNIDVKKSKGIIAVLCFLLIVLIALSAVLVRSNLRYKRTDRNFNAEISSYKDVIDQKGKELESYSKRASDYESERNALNSKIDDLNKQISIKREQQAQATAPVSATPQPVTPAGEAKTVYLTFDDGPSPHTPAILQILDQYGVKATFFVKDNGSYNAYMKDIVTRGHVIALHSQTHNYSYIYSSDEAFYSDMKNISDIVFQQTGVRTNIMRFPGGSSNTVSKKYNAGIMSRLTKGVTNMGYYYYDWNCDSTDASGNNVPVEKLVSSCMRMPSSNTVIVLMHDTNAKATTVQALPQIIENYRNAGCQFGVISPQTPAVHHSVNN